MSVVEQESIQSLIRTAMERVEIVDVRAIADLVVAELDDEALLRGLAVKGVMQDVRMRLKMDRREDTAQGSGRWDDVKRRQASGELDLTRVSIWTGESHKWILDCHAQDLVAAADEHLKVSLGHEQSAERLGKLAKVLHRATGASVVGDLPEEKVRAILNA